MCFAEDIFDQQIGTHCVLGLVEDEFAPRRVRIRVVRIRHIRAKSLLVAHICVESPGISTRMRREKCRK